MRELRIQLATELKRIASAETIIFPKQVSVDNPYVDIGRAARLNLNRHPLATETTQKSADQISAIGSPSKHLFPAHIRTAPGSASAAGSSSRRQTSVQMSRRRRFRWASLSFNWVSLGQRERGEAKRWPVITSTALLLLFVATLETPIISFISSQKQPPSSISNDTSSNNSGSQANNYIPIDQKQQQQRQILDGMVTANVVFVNENNNVNDTDPDSAPIEFDSDDSDSDSDSDLDTRNTNLLFQSARYRAMLLAHIFNEFNVKNLSLQASANVLGYKAIQAPEDYLRIPASQADLTSSVVPPEEPSASLAQSGRHPPLDPPASRPFFGDVFYSFQTVYWPIHCVICLVICTLGIFANVTNIIVLTR